MGKQRLLLGLIVLLAIAAIVVIVQVPTRLGLDLRGGTQLTLQVETTEKIPNITAQDMDAVERVISDRVNELGVSETSVQQLGQNQLLVQLPGVSDPEQAQRVLGETAQLEFRPQSPGTEQQLQIESQILRQHQLELTALQEADRSGDQSLIEAAGNDDTAEVNANLEAQRQAIQQDIQESNEAIRDLFAPADLTGEKLTDAFARPSQSGLLWEVVIEFDSDGSNQFADISRSIAGTGRSIGIFLDNRLLSAPTVDVQYAETGITGGSAVISGNFDAESASDLAIQLRGGALPLPVEVVETRTVGPTLGQDSIRRSLYAAMVGLFLVLVFMAVYYRLPGVLADVALVVYALLTLATFNIFGVTLTLPGIAGFILSIGMAVDANVLIFERTREELRSGKTLYRSVESGFYRAFSSILDSNVTTLIACAALFRLGAGLVKGFALTLGIGVVISLFTAITCSRTLLLFSLGLPQFRKPELFCPDLSTTPSKS
ncbi:protein translocase subunit SecD [Oscillatoria sp. CS-180]|uniref:protein translocase subunit SecD n=1 Tax=Oscillatoria sp. CS-180 TaxID=3021720 RepID=UPI00232C1AD2|nr:protein translocase subunit SecD [Oscillatoria sp. CS-180]MDB9528348.1 protein translocase subunit SecD [Oscillatoria sp. CS-180]